MDYFVKGRILIADETQLAALLTSQENLKTVDIKRGTARRGVAIEGPDLFIFEVRTFQEGGALVYFNELKELMTAQNIPGVIHWHECNHDEGIGGCAYDGTFEHLGGA